MTSERWEDGYPIYRKTIRYGQMNIPVGSILRVVHGIPNIKSMRINYAASTIYTDEAYTNSTGRCINDYTPGSTATNAWFWTADNTYIYGHSGYARTGWYASAVLEYTKTTDTPQAQ